MTNGLEEEYSIENPFNLHYINNEINEYGNISEFEAINTVSEETAVRTAFIAGNKDENSLTNIIFFDRHHELNKNERLKPHQKELINEWLRIRNNIIRPILAELKSKGKESTKYSQPTLDKLLGSLPEPMKLPPENPVEFAPEPVGIAHWPVRPVRTEDKDWHVVSYRFGPGKNDFVRGRNTAREFYAFRGVDRLHAANDLYGNAGDQVVAIQDGVFLYAIENFLGDTSAMYIQHTIEQPNMIFVYGEVEKYSWRSFNLKIGDKVKAGQVIATLGITPGGSSMLHCETWGLGIIGIKNRLHSSFRSWKKGGQPPKYVLNPTKYLLAVRKQELERRRKQQQSSPPSTYKSTFNESLVPIESESFFGSVFSDVRGRLTWGKEYDTISSAYRAGNHDENSLTNIIFFDRHTELNKNVPLKPHQKELIQEWLNIRDNIVRPIIAELKKKPSDTSTPSSGKDDDCKVKWEREIKEFPQLVINAINGDWEKHWEDAVLLAIQSGIYDSRILTRIVYFNNKQFLEKKYKFGYCDPKDTEAKRIYEISQKVVKDLLTYPRPPLVKFDPYQCSKHDSKMNYNIIDNPLTKLTGRYYSTDPYRVYIINQAGLHFECVCSNVNRQRASYEIDRKHWSIHGDQLQDGSFLWFKRTSPTTYGKIRKKGDRLYMSVTSSNEEPKGVEYELIKMEGRPSILGSGAKIALPSSIDIHLFRQGELFPLTSVMKKMIETDLDKNFLENIFEDHFIKGKNSQAKLIERLKSIKRFSTQERPLVQIHARKILTDHTWVYNKMLKSHIDWIQHMLDQRGDTYEYREYLGLHAISNKSTGMHVYKFEFSLTGIAGFLGGGFGGEGTIEKTTGNIKWKEKFYFSLFGISLTPPPFFDLSINKKYKGIARSDYEWFKQNFSGFVELAYIEGSLGLGFASAEAGLMYVNGDRFFPPMTVFFQDAGFDYPNIDEIISILIDKKYIAKNKSFSWKDLVDVTFRDIAGRIRLPSSNIETPVITDYSKRWYPELDFSVSNIKFLHFCRDADSLTDFGIHALRIICARELLMFRNKTTSLKIIGHADTLAKGKFVQKTNIDYNLDLSERRANMTLQYIKNILGDDFKIQNDNIKKEGWGDRIADKDFGGRIVDSPKHRKVEILINSNIVLNLFG